MRGDTTAEPIGIPELIHRADQKGSLTAAEIAEILDVDDLALEYRSTWTVGE